MGAAVSGDQATTTRAADQKHGGGRTALVLRVLLGSAGVATLGYGAWGLFGEAHGAALGSLVHYLIGGLLLHDAVLAPIVFTLGAIAYRITGPRLRRTLAAVLLIGGSAALIALPEFMLPPGNPNPTVHPLDYVRDLAVVLGAVLAAALLYLMFPPLRDRRRARRSARAEALEESLQTEEASPEPIERGSIPGADA